jgi:hypothetical protein
MKADLKRLHSPDAHDLQSFQPPDPECFSVFIQAMIGPEHDETFESFDLMVCSPAWLRQKVEEQGPVLGMHHLVVASFHYPTIEGAIKRFCARCLGDTWQEVALKVGRLGRWEFDDRSEERRQP